MHLRAALFALLTTFLCAGFRCDGNAAQIDTPRARPIPDLRLFVLTDPKGYLEPCGCQLEPLGGVDKLAAVVGKARQEKVPVLTLAAGDLTFGSVLRPEDADGARQQELWRAETLVDIWSELGMSAVVPGPLDLSQTRDVTEGLIKRSHFPWLLDNLEGQGSEAYAKGRVLDAGGIKVGVFGLLSPQATLQLPQGMNLNVQFGEQAKRVSDALRAQGARVVVALITGDRKLAREVAGSGVDVVVLGGVDQEKPLAPSVHGGAVIVHAGYQGQHVVQLDLKLDAQGAWQDASEWTLRTQKADLESRIKELRDRLAAWEKEPNVKAADLATQRSRLAELERELAQKSAPSYAGRWFSAEPIDLSPRVKGDPKVAQRVDAYDKRVNEHNRVSLADKKPLPAPEGAAHYAGSESCKGCHAEAYAWWKNTKHGRAYATLEHVNKQFNLSCVGCHVTGYNQPGGSTVTHVENLKDVGCENCHGAGSLHNTQPEKAGLVARHTPEAVCVGCHNHEHSSRFAYDAFKTLLIVPGHGLPASTN